MHDPHHPHYPHHQLPTFAGQHSPSAYTAAGYGWGAESGRPLPRARYASETEETEARLQEKLEELVAKIMSRYVSAPVSAPVSGPISAPASGPMSSPWPAASSAVLWVGIVIGVLCVVIAALLIHMTLVRPMRPRRLADADVAAMARSILAKRRTAAAPKSRDVVPDLWIKQVTREVKRQEAMGP
jgi:hypothetical protein